MITSASIASYLQCVSLLCLIFFGGGFWKSGFSLKKAAKDGHPLFYRYLSFATGTPLSPFLLLCFARKMKPFFEKGTPQRKASPPLPYDKWVCHSTSAEAAASVCLCSHQQPLSVRPPPPFLEVKGKKVTLRHPPFLHAEDISFDKIQTAFSN